MAWLAWLSGCFVWLGRRRGCALCDAPSFPVTASFSPMSHRSVSLPGPGLQLCTVFLVDMLYAAAKLLKLLGLSALVKSLPLSCHKADLISYDSRHIYTPSASKATSAN